MSTVREQLDAAIDTHTRVVGEYQQARITVAGWETYGVLTPGEVDRLEYQLADLYEVIQDQSAELARISAVLEFGRDE